MMLVVRGSGKLFCGIFVNGGKYDTNVCFVMEDIFSLRIAQVIFFCLVTWNAEYYFKGRKKEMAHDKLFVTI